MNELTTETRNWALAAHLSPVLVQLMMPSLGFVGPLAVMLIKQDQPTVAWHAKQALYFQLAMMFATWAIGAVAAGLSCFIIGWFIMPFTLIPLAAGYIVPVLAALKVNNGEDFTYPVTGTMVPQP